ncbi:MAG: hypothetical protein KDD45_12560, partial [Bdellovibrionales bacterium]|nr:hypothetical protein [Bdellovibrionales bacterium]
MSHIRLIVFLMISFSIGVFAKTPQVVFENISNKIVSDVTTRYLNQAKTDNFLSVLDDIIRYIHTKSNYDIVRVEKSENK